VKRGLVEINLRYVMKNKLEIKRPEKIDTRDLFYKSIKKKNKHSKTTVNPNKEKK
jgi:hypothetical protein